MGTSTAGVILIVDDDANVRRSLAEALQPFKAELRLAASGEEALEMLAESRFRLVLLDLTLPGLDGLAVLETLERKQASVPVIALVEDASAAEVTEAKAHGAAAVLEKPVTATRARAAVRDQLHRRERETGDM